MCRTRWTRACEATVGEPEKPQKFVKYQEWRWWVVALLPRFVAKWLWILFPWVRRTSWAPHIMGQATGVRGHCIRPPRTKRHGGDGD